MAAIPGDLAPKKKNDHAKLSVNWIANANKALRRGWPLDRAHTRQAAIAIIT